MWRFDDHLDVWFKRVEKDRKDNVKPPDDDGDELDDDSVDRWMRSVDGK